MVTGTAECVLLVMSWGSGILTGRAKLANVLDSVENKRGEGDGC